VNSMDQYSKPLRKKETKFGTKFYFNPRRTKPGRELVVMYDKRFPIVDFEPTYSYIVRFLEKNNAAGNHYHKRKEEVFIPIEGTFEVHLEDVSTKEREIVSLKSSDIVAFHFRTGIAHKIISKNDSGLLLTMSSDPSRDEDEIDYKVE